MKKFEIPNIKVLCFTVADVITSSPTDVSQPAKPGLEDNSNWAGQQ